MFDDHLITKYEHYILEGKHNKEVSDFVKWIIKENQEYLLEKKRSVV